jgi:translation initiation factor IF-2
MSATELTQATVWQGQYVHHKEVKAALGVKIVAPELEKAIAGSRLMVVGEDDDEEEMREEVMSDLVSLLDSVDKSGKGVWVQASTLGSLEALLEFLKQSKIPVRFGFLTKFVGDGRVVLTMDGHSRYRASISGRYTSVIS